MRATLSSGNASWEGSLTDTPTRLAKASISGAKMGASMATNLAQVLAELGESDTEVRAIASDFGALAERLTKLLPAFVPLDAETERRKHDAAVAGEAARKERERAADARLFAEMRPNDQQPIPPVAPKGTIDKL